MAVILAVLISCADCGCDVSKFRITAFDGDPRCRRCHVVRTEQKYGESDRQGLCRGCGNPIEPMRRGRAVRCLGCASQKIGASRMPVGGYHRDGAASAV